MFKQQLNALPAEQRATMGASKDEYIAFYFMRAKDVHLAVSRETGRLLYMLARATNARAMIEFGTSFGISTWHLAAALRDNGGKLITTDPLHGRMTPPRPVRHGGRVELVPVLQSPQAVNAPLVL